MLGYAVHTVELNTLDHFLPQHRVRLWIMGARRDTFTGKLTESEVEQLFHTITTNLSQPPNVRLSLGDVLLAETHPAIARMLDLASAAPECLSEGRANSAKRVKWASDHIDMVGVDQWIDNRLHIDEQLLQMYPGFKLLTSRQLDLALTRGISLPTENDVCLNLSQTAHFATLSKGYTSTITPKGWFFLCNRVRLHTRFRCKV